jgi:hypothetical protein
MFKDPPFVTVEGEIRGDMMNVNQDATKLDVKDTERDLKILAELEAIKTDLNKDPRLYLYVAKVEEIEEDITTEKRPTPAPCVTCKSSSKKWSEPTSRPG